jgi:hypothetical protein
VREWNVDLNKVGKTFFDIEKGAANHVYSRTNS